jgi:DNA-directed RNA polymerase specialized sigma24 family protein
VDTDIDQLPSRLKEHDEGAIRIFFDVFGPRLRRYFLALGSCSADAEALAVSCLTDIALFKVQKFEDRGPKAFESWVFRVAKRAWIDERRGRFGCLCRTRFQIIRGWSLTREWSPSEKSSSPG